MAYAAGDAANNLAFSMTSFFLRLLHRRGRHRRGRGRDLFLVIRIWDGFADIFAGRAVDGTMTRWGTFPPFFLFGGLPVLLLSSPPSRCRGWSAAAAGSCWSPT